LGLAGGGVASRSRPIGAPETPKGLKVRGGLAGNGHGAADRGGCRAVECRPTNFTRRCRLALRDAVSPPPTSLISFRIEEVEKSLRPARGALMVNE